MSLIHVIGMSDAGLASLSGRALELVKQARLIAGGTRHLAAAQGLAAETLALQAPMDAALEQLAKEAQNPDPRPVVVFSSGDPLFFGIGKSLLQRLAPETLRIHPGVSSMQLAFARAGLSWEDACLVSVHGRSLEPLLGADPTASKLGIFTDDKNTPSVIADFLMHQGWPGSSQAWVLEDLEGSAEKCTQCALADLPQRSFGSLNVLLLQRVEPQRAADLFAFALPDEAFERRSPKLGLITKAEVRAVVLSKLRLFPSARVYDVGAGSGSVAIESARLCRKGRVWAIEKDEEDCRMVQANIERFATPQVTLVHGRAPEALSGIPEDPDAVFVGGSGGALASILEACFARLKPGGSLVATTVTLENTHQALAWYKGHEDWDMLQMQVSRRAKVLDLNRLEALNPVSLFWLKKA
jgi:precorrin-6Y C5,15-methyltransferase (decarboxylating)